jgi:hypothetical protein
MGASGASRAYVAGLRAAAPASAAAIDAGYMMGAADEEGTRGAGGCLENKRARLGDTVRHSFPPRLSGVSEGNASNDASPMECDDEDDVDKVREIAVGDFLDPLYEIINM